LKSFFLGVLCALAALAIGAVAYLLLGFAEVRADLPPSGFEVSLMTAAVHASVRRVAPAVPNPVPPTDENLIGGGKFYLNNCSGCHGPASKPENEASDTLFPPIPQFNKVGTTYTEAQVFWIAKHGIRRTGMFANGKWYADKDLWSVAAYIKRINSLPPAVQEALAKPTR
jgi:thiosulfate dehydrogenase